MKYAFVLRQDPVTQRVSMNLEDRLKSIGWIYDEKQPDVLISIGGDGTLLRGIHQYLDRLDSLFVVGLHTGTLGFLTDYTKEELDDFVRDLQSGPKEIQLAPLLKIEPTGKDPVYALNEVRIESLEKTLSLEIYIDQEFFELCRGSGICISTQAGSTAVNRALQGAVIDSGLSVLQLCEIMPISHQNHHSLRNPYIMKDDRTIQICGTSLFYARACFDHLSISLENVPSIQISMSEKRVKFARYRSYSYLKRLKNLY